MVTLETLTVGQFQEIYKIQKAEMDTDEKMTEMVAILSGKTVSEVDDLPLPEFNNLAREIGKVLSQPMPTPKPSRVIKGYGITYEPAKLNRGQYVTVNHFMKGDPIDNCHLILASLTYDIKTGKHEAERHAEIAEGLQDANFVDVYAACLFFSQLFTVSIRGLGSYLESEVAKKMNPEEAKRVMRILMAGLGGSTMQNRWPNLRA